MLALSMLSSMAVPAFAVEYSTDVVYVGEDEGKEWFKLTVPAQMAPGGTDDVTLEGVWSSTKTYTVTADETVEMKSNLGITKTLGITFPGISLTGSEEDEVSDTQNISIDSMKTKLGTYKGTFYYNLGISDSGDLGGGSSDTGNDIEDDDNIELEAGLYSDGEMLATWDELVDDYGLDIEKNYTSSTYKSDSASCYNVLKNNFSEYSNFKLVMPDSVTSVGYGAFQEAPLTSITLSNNITKIEYGMFNSCESLTSIIIPNGVTSIGAYSFAGCSSLTSITIPSSVTSIGYYGLAGCSVLISINYGGTSEQWETIDKSSTWNYATTGYNIYYNVIINTGGSSETEDGDNEENTSDDNVGDDVVTEADFVVKSSNRAAIGYTGSANETLVIPSTFTGDGKNGTTEGTVYTVTSIDQEAFSSCENLESVIIPNTVTSIGLGVFYKCTGLTSITLSDNLTSIGIAAFRECASLKSITIPESVTSLGNLAFYKCTGLTSVTLSDNITSIGNSTFMYCADLTSVNIPNSATSLGEQAFSGCTGLKSITIPSSVTSIQDLAFHGCTGLKSITIPSSVTSIGNQAFSACTGLKSITIPSSVTSLGNNVFNSCDSLVSAIIPSSVTSIEDGLFNVCNNLKSVTIPSSVTSIGTAAFSGCKCLTSITYTGTKSQWEAITKGSYWNSNTDDYTVYCTNGNIAKS